MVSPTLTRTSAAGNVTVPRRGGAASRSRVTRFTAIPFLIPALALVGIMLLVPFAATVYQSLTRDNGFTSEFIGIDNYVRLFGDAGFLQSLVNTVMWTVGTLILPVGLGLLIAVFTSSMRIGKWLRFAFILPYALSGAATAVIWGFILRSDGALNQAISFLGMTPPAAGWLLEWPGNTIVMIVANTWQATGVTVILFLVGLQSIPQETVEAGQLDGASGMRLFWNVVLPQLRPVTIVVIGMSIATYEQGNVFNHEQTRTRKLLLHRREIDALHVHITRKGNTLIPISLYFKGGRAKLLIGVAKGKDKGDKRQTIMERDTKRQIDRDIKEARG